MALSLMDRIQAQTCLCAGRFVCLHVTRTPARASAEDLRDWHYACKPFCWPCLFQEEVVRARRAVSRGKAGAATSGTSPEVSPFVAIAATMGWETFHLVQVLWLGNIDLPVNAPEKDWQLQVSRADCCTPCQMQQCA